MKPGCFSSCLFKAGSRLFKARSAHSWDNIFHLNTLSWDEKHPALIFLRCTVTIKQVLICLSFISCLKKNIHPKFRNILKRTFTLTDSNKHSKLLKSSLPVRFFKNSLYKVAIYSGHFE